MIQKMNESGAKDYHQLNREQKAAADQLEQNIILLAPAGTGKTKTLANRIANIIAQNKSKPEEILCITFTNRACKEMKDRVVSVVGEKGAGVVVKTFHSFCFDIIKSEAKKNTDISWDFIIYDEEDCKEVVQEMFGRRYSVQSIQNFINQVKELKGANTSKTLKETVDIMFKYRNDKVRDICKNSGNGYRVDEELYSFLRDNGARIVEGYNKTLKDRHSLDFNDLIINTWELFMDQKIAERWKEKFRFIHIDEVQDTSDRDYNIISKIFKNSNVMICGDPFQTIYSWRGSKPQEILDRFKRDKNPIEIILKENYRSTETLLNGSYEYLKNAFPNDVHKVYEEGIRACAEDGGKNICINKSGTSREEGSWIYERIEKIIGDNSIEDISRIAVLTRNNKINCELWSYFNDLNRRRNTRDTIPFIMVDEFKLYRRQEIKDITAYLKFIINKHDENSLRRILNRFAKGIGARTIEKILSEENRQHGIRLVDFVDTSTIEYGDPYLQLITNLENENVVVFDVESTGVNTTEDEIIQIAAVKIDKDGGVVESFEEFIRPSKSVGDSKYVHGFDNEYLLENGREGRAVLEEFLQFIRGTIVVGHNVSYDINILKSQLARLGMKEPEFRDYYDTLDMARRFYPHFENHKLETLCRLMETETKSSHDAMDDILATKDVLIRIIEESVQPKIMNRMAVYGESLDKFKEISYELTSLREKSDSMRPYEVIAEVVEVSKIKEVYKDEQGRIEKIRYFYRNVKEMDDKGQNSRDALIELLKVTSLSNSELDTLLSKHPRIPIITIHQAKGSEFDYVFMAGIEDYVFPSYQAIRNENLDEEKRLMYVGMTRAKKELYLTYSGSRNGKDRNVSRLINYIPDKFLDK